MTLKNFLDDCCIVHYIILCIHLQVRFRVVNVKYPQIPIEQEKNAKPFAPMAITVRLMFIICSFYQLLMNVLFLMIPLWLIYIHSSSRVPLRIMAVGVIWTATCISRAVMFHWTYYLVALLHLPIALFNLIFHGHLHPDTHSGALVDLS